MSWPAIVGFNASSPHPGAVGWRLVQPAEKGRFAFRQSEPMAIGGARDSRNRDAKTRQAGLDAAARTGSVVAGLVVLAVSCAAAGEEGAVTPQITVDQFGWLPRSAKVAILADPVKGQNAGQTYRPGERFEIRREPDGTSAYRGTTKPWNMGKVSELAGDRVWYADFSDLRAPGTYHVYDPANKVRSFSFRIADDVYRPVLRDAVRVFYYQRSGTPDHGAERRRLASSRRSPGARPGPCRAVQPGREDPGPAAEPAGRLVRRGRPEQVRALPGGHALRPALGVTS